MMPGGGTQDVSGISLIGLKHSKGTSNKVIPDEESKEENFNSQGSQIRKTDMTNRNNGLLTQQPPSGDNTNKK